MCKAERQDFSHVDFYSGTKPEAGDIDEGTGMAMAGRIFFFVGTAASAECATRAVAGARLGAGCATGWRESAGAMCS